MSNRAERRKHAAEERDFSMVRKNKTPFQSSIDPDETLGSILTAKLAMDRPLRFEPTNDLLWKAKKITWAYNQRHILVRNDYESHIGYALTLLF